jgi:hypothetical protein
VQEYYCGAKMATEFDAKMAPLLGGDKKLGNYSAKSGSGNSLTGMKRMKGIKLKKGICTYLILSQQNA